MGGMCGLGFGRSIFRGGGGMGFVMGGFWEWWGVGGGATSMAFFWFVCSLASLAMGWGWGCDDGRGSFCHGFLGHYLFFSFLPQASALSSKDSPTINVYLAQVSFLHLQTRVKCARARSTHVIPCLPSRFSARLHLERRIHVNCSLS